MGPYVDAVTVRELKIKFKYKMCAIKYYKT